MKSMQLTPQQQLVFTHYEMNTRQTVVELARICGLRNHSVRAVLAFFERYQIATPYLSVSPAALGFTDFGIFIRRGLSAHDRKKFLSFISKNAAITWFVELGGMFQFCFSYLAKDVGDVDLFLVQISEQFPGVVHDRYVAPRISWRQYPHKFFSWKKRSTDTLSWKSGVPAVKLDKDDRAVLQAMSAEPGQSVSALARSLAMPPSSFQYRLDRLVHEGVICGFPAYLNYNCIGLRKYLVLIYEHAPSHAWRERLEKFVMQHPHITTCLRSLAEWTYELDVALESAEELNQLRQEIIESFGESISKLEILEYLRTHKIRPYAGISL